MYTPAPDLTEQLRAENAQLRAQLAAAHARAAASWQLPGDALTDPSLWFDAVSDAIFIADAAWTIQRWNEAAAHLYGWTPAEAVGRPIRDLIPVTDDLDGGSDADAFRSLQATGSWRGTMRQRTADGRALVVEGSTRALTNAHGAITGYVGINRDVTARHQAEAALEHERRQLQAILTTMHEGVVAARPDGTLAVINPAALALADLDPSHPPATIQAFAQQTTQQAYRVTGEDLAPDDWPLVRALRGERFAEQQLRLRSRCGAPERWQTFSGTPVYDAHGVLQLAVITGLDSTARAQHEAQLRQHAALLDHAHVLVRDAESRIVFWNAGAQRLYGWTAEEALGRSSHELLQTRFPVPLEQVEAQLAASGRWEGELVHRQRDGSELVVASLWVVLPEAPGQPPRILEVNNDITAAKRAEAALRDQEQQLQHLIDTTDGVLWSMDTAFRLLVGNRLFHEQIRAASGHAIAVGDSLILSSLPADLQAERRKIYGRALAGETFTLERSTRVADPPRRLEERYSPIRASDGSIIGVAVFMRDVTEQRHAAQERHDTERKLAAVLDLLPVGVAILDTHGAVVYTNPAQRQIAQLDERPLPSAQQPERQYLRPDGTARPIAEFATTRALREQRLVADVETGIVLEGGELVWTRVSATPVAIADWRVVAVMTDVTARKQGEARLQAAQAEVAVHSARLTSILAHAPIGISLVDTDLRFQHINDQLAAINGLPPAAHLGRSLRAVLPDLAPALEPIYRQVLATGVPILDVSITGETQAASGERRTWRVSYFPVRSADGALLGAGAIVMDITAQLLAEAKLHDTERKLGTLFDILPVGIAITGDDGEIAYTNPAYERLIGGDSDWLNASQSPSRQYLRQDGTELPHSAFARVRAFQERQTVSGQETGIRGADGAIHWLSISAVPVDIPHWRVVTTLTDITPRVRAEAEVRGAAEALARANADLTRALQLKDEFLAMISHELRTPLNVVLGYAEALAEEAYGPMTVRQQELLARISGSGRHLLSILSDILDLTQLSAGGVTVTPEPLDLDVVCVAALQFVQQRARAKQITLLRSVVVGVERVRADQRRLTQILVNLLDNAVKFTPVGGTVGLEVTADEAREQIHLAVWDTGIGIAESDMGRLFQPFTQVDGRLSRAYEGVGLGLTLVRRLVDLHGGSVTLTSAPEQGSRFTVTLPWTAADNEREPEPLPALRPPAWGQPPHVLVVDDDEATVTLYGAHLSALGCRVRTARTGVEALTRVREHAPDILVLDIQLPELDGISVLERLRSDPATAALPVLAVTALAMPGDRERALAAGATAYLAKPVSLRTLVETMGRVWHDAASGER